MAGLRICRNVRNTLKASTNSGSIFVLRVAIFLTFTLVPTQTSVPVLGKAPALTQILVSDLPNIHTIKNL